MPQSINHTASELFQTIKPFLTNENLLTVNIIFVFVAFFTILIVAKNKKVKITSELLITRTLSGILMINGLFISLACFNIDILTTLIHSAVRQYIAIAGLALMYLGFTRVFASFEK